MAIPNFFIIGAPKCGTTALSEYLRGNPNVFLSSPKEPKYFDFDLSYPVKMDREAYLSLFSRAEPRIHKAIGEASTSYLFSKCAVTEILRFNPEAKLIVMLRNPVDLVPGWHNQCLIAGQENILDFQEAWQAEAARKKGEKKPLLCLEIKNLFYSEWGKLGDQMERLYATVPRDKVKVILFEEFVAQTPKVYEDVLSFLGVPSDGRRDFPKINEHERIRWSWLQRVLRSASMKVPSLKKRLGLSKGLGITSKLMALNSRNAKKEPVPEEMLSELRSFYRDDVMKLSRILGRDLSHWLGSNNFSTDGEKC